MTRRHSAGLPEQSGWLLWELTLSRWGRKVTLWTTKIMLVLHQQGEALQTLIERTVAR